MSSEKTYSNWYFLGISLIIFIIAILLKPEKLNIIFSFAISILLKIIPILLFVYVLMFIFNLISDNENIIKHFTGNDWKSLLIAIIGGIISSGPIYMWYPLLNELQKKKVRNGLIATFLYNRAIKIPLMPLMIMYFGLKFTVILTFVMIFFSVIQGFIIDFLMEVKS